MEIIPGIHQVDRVNGNAYILIRDRLVIIDTGIPGSGKTILSYIRDTLHRKPDEIRTVILTHFHTDHIGGVRELKKAAPGLKTAVHEAEARIYFRSETASPLQRVQGAAPLLVCSSQALIFPTGYPP